MATVETVNESCIVYSYREFLGLFRRGKKRALLSYLAQPVIDSMSGKEITRFSNSGIVISWARVLNELGYIVDVINWDDRNFKPVRPYDLVIFHGGKNFEKIYKNLHGKPKIIHFLTGSYWKFNNEGEDRRRADFKRRHGIETPRDRYIYANEDPVNRAADLIIVLGDPSMKQTYKQYDNVTTINNASYPDEHFDKVNKDYSKARNNFLFFAGSGNIHKGLDLLIDAFKNLEEHLYIVTVPDKQVLDTFKKELNLPNIHLIGQVNMRDPKFYEIMDKCAFVILPSCSEGQAGSVVEAMNQGLIPIVSKETRLDTRGYGVILAGNTIPCIKKTVNKLSRMTADDVNKMSIRTRKIAVKQHSPEKFRDNLKTAVLQIINT